ncbi:MAG: hypothetical protein JXR65_07640 [Bacteroidales bacterium]|nr:hypothetical protein [Bacteroidales bacterium]
MMKKLMVSIILLFTGNLLLAQEYLNKIGLDPAYSYVVMTPKYNKPLNQYNPYMRSSGAGYGLSYERLFQSKPYGLKTGFYFIRQFSSVYSFYVPLEFNGDLLGKNKETTLYAGYVAGLGLNFAIPSLTGVGSGILIFGPNYFESDITIKKKFYMAPHAGIQAGINLKHLFFSFQGLFHFLVPEFVSYKTLVEDDNGKQTTEYNTNKHWGITLGLGLGISF